MRSFQGDTVMKNPSEGTADVKEEDDPDFELTVLKGGAQFIQAGWSRGKSVKPPPKAITATNIFFSLDRIADTRSPGAKTGKEGFLTSQGSITTPSIFTGTSQPTPVDMSSQNEVPQPNQPTPVTSAEFLSYGSNWSIPPQPFKPGSSDTTEFDVDTLMGWIAAEEASLASSSSAPAQSTHSNPNPLLEGPAAHLNVNYPSGDSPEGMLDLSDINPAQSAAWFHATFGPNLAEAGAAEVSFAPLPQFGSQDHHSPEQSSSSDSQSGPSASAHRLPPELLQQHDRAKELSFDLWARKESSGQLNGNSQIPGSTPQNGLDTSFMDAWRMQAALDGLDSMNNLPTNGFSNLF